MSDQTLTILPPGAERDRLVAEAMGWQTHHIPKALNERGSWDCANNRDLWPHDFMYPNYSSDDVIFISECLPWLRSKLEAWCFEIYVDGNQFAFSIPPRDNPKNTRVSGKSLADAGTQFILKAKGAGLLG